MSIAYVPPGGGAAIVYSHPMLDSPALPPRQAPPRAFYPRPAVLPISGPSFCSSGSTLDGLARVDSPCPFMLSLLESFSRYFPLSETCSGPRAWPIARCTHEREPARRSSAAGSGRARLARRECMTPRRSRCGATPARRTSARRRRPSPARVRGAPPMCAVAFAHRML